MFVQFTIINVYFSPYFDHDAFMHHALHVLETLHKVLHALFAFDCYVCVLVIDEMEAID